ncbi:MAG: hypothetical protein PHV32_13240 [Eubacteriales bacterium]|nr:hypothetical protein [Eubacteriales bacterium]
MARKIEMPVIELVEFYYAGSDKQFNEFLKAIVREYVIDDKLLPDDKKEIEKSA